MIIRWRSVLQFEHAHVKKMYEKDDTEVIRAQEVKHIKALIKQLVPKVHRKAPLGAKTPDTRIHHFI
jgi:hypothetical protein